MLFNVTNISGEVAKLLTHIKKCLLNLYSVYTPKIEGKGYVMGVDKQ